jgi:hypothetical protein
MPINNLMSLTIILHNMKNTFAIKQLFSEYYLRTKRHINIDINY